jgi:hypothetical protein
MFSLQSAAASAPQAPVDQREELAPVPRQGGRSYASRLMSRVNELAVPIIAIGALACLPGASGGPLAYSACVIGCTTLTGPAAITCFYWCLGLLPLPGP